MTFSAFNVRELKRPTAIQVGVRSVSFKLLDRAGGRGWTDGYLLSLNMPKFVQTQLESDTPDLATLPVLNPITLERLAAKYESSDGAQPADALELAPQAFKHDSHCSPGKPLELVVLGSAELDLAVEVSRCYVAYLKRVYKGVKFYTRESHVSAGKLKEPGIGAYVDGRLVAIVSAFDLEAKGLRKWLATQTKEAA